MESDRCTEQINWYHQQESNLYLALRRHSFYPLNYGGGFCNPGNGCAGSVNCIRWLFSVIRYRKYQIHRALLAGLRTYGESLRQVVKQI